MLTPSVLIENYIEHIDYACSTRWDGDRLSLLLLIRFPITDSIIDLEASDLKEALEAIREKSLYLPLKSLLYFMLNIDNVLGGVE